MRRCTRSFFRYAREAHVVGWFDPRDESDKTEHALGLPIDTWDDGLAKGRPVLFRYVYSEADTPFLLESAVDFESFLVAWYLDPKWLSPTAHPSMFCCSIGWWLDETDVDDEDGTNTMNTADGDRDGGSSGGGSSSTEQSQVFALNGLTYTMTMFHDKINRDCSMMCLFVSSFCPTVENMVHSVRIPALRRFFCTSNDSVDALPDYLEVTRSWAQALPHWLG